jgi:transcriptional regulator with XRE-family HTH domain
LELRRAAGLSRKQLGDAVGVEQNTIRRYETGEISISLDMLQAIATALRCDVADLIASDGGLEDDVALEIPAFGMLAITSAIGRRGLKIYRVLTDVLADADIRRSHRLLVDESNEACSARKAGDALVLRISTGPLLLRQYLPPHLLVTNRFGVDNSTLKLNDRTLRVDVVGIVIEPIIDGGISDTAH